MRTRRWLWVVTLVGLSSLFAWCARTPNPVARVTLTRETLVWPTNVCGETRDVSARWAIFVVPQEAMGTIESYRYGKDYRCLNVRFDDGRHGYVMDDRSVVFDAALSPCDEEIFPLF